MKGIAIAVALLLTTAVEAQQLVSETVPVTTGTLLTCESKNNVRHTCSIDARGRLVTVNQQLSDNPCIAGRTWGLTRNRKGIWVDNGCRAEFLVGGVAVARSAFGRTIACQSINNGKSVCPIDTSHGVQLSRQISKNDCVRGKDWGFDENSVWVDNGCRAEFTVGGAVVRTTIPMTSSTRSTVVCESQNNALNRCAANTIYGVTLARQLSNNMCVRGQTWGYDADGIWVTRGCRGEFVLAW